jgi:hypothetical protein
MSEIQIRRPITRAELIEQLGVSTLWFNRHVAQLRQEQGFPRPLLNGKYDPAAVADWQERQRTAGRPHDGQVAAAQPANDDETAEIEAARRAMDARAMAGR